jgi:cell division initiation protein
LEEKGDAMKLTPLDLQQKTFRKTRLGGVDEAEVKAFLGESAAEMEELLRKVHQQDEDLRKQIARIAEYREREQLLQTTLTTAQRLTEEMKTSSRKEAELVLSSAELQAEKIIANAQAKRLQLIGEIEELKRVKVAFLSQLAGILESHRAMLETVRGSDAHEPPRVPVPAVGDNVSFLSPPSKRGETK